MAMTRGPFAKRQKELARREKQKEKLARRLEAKQPGDTDVALAEGEDPDIAGIQLGPQPREDELGDDTQENEADKPESR